MRLDNKQTAKNTYDKKVVEIKIRIKMKGKERENKQISILVFLNI
jgi:hypothetical protein